MLPTKCCRRMLPSTLIDPNIAVECCRRRWLAQMLPSNIAVDADWPKCCRRMLPSTLIGPNVAVECGRRRQLFRCCRWRNFDYNTKDEFNIRYKTYFRPDIEFSIQAWSSYLEKDVGVTKEFRRELQIWCTAWRIGSTRTGWRGGSLYQDEASEKIWSRHWLAENMHRQESVLHSVNYHKPERPRSEAVQTKITSSGTLEILQPADRWHLEQAAAGCDGI